MQLPIWGHPPYLLRLQSMRTFFTWQPGNYDIGYPQATQLEDGTILCAYYGYTSGAVEGRLNSCGIFHGIYASLFDETWLAQRA